MSGSKIKVKIWYDETSQPVAYENVLNTYTKGPLYCLYLDDETVTKVPLNKIWRVVEDYGTHRS